MALIALAVFITIIITWSVAVKRNMGEAMILGFIGTALFAGQEMLPIAWAAIIEASTSVVVYAAAAFIFMAYLVEKTGVITRLTDILSSVFGRLRGGPAYVDAIVSGTLGAIAGGSNTGNAAASGSITGPWMTRTGWSRERAATVIAGNAGLGAGIPPSASMVIVAGLVASMTTLESIYIGLLCAGLYQVLHRVVVTFAFTRIDRIPRMHADEIPPFVRALSSGWPTLLIFLAAALPIVFTAGPGAIWLEESTPLGEAVGDASLIVWIPVFIIATVVAIAWRSLPRSAPAAREFAQGVITRYSTIVVIIFFAIAASEILSELGLSQEVADLLERASLPTWLLLIIVSIFVVVIAGPLSSTATVTTIGQVVILTLVDVGIDPAVAAVVLLTLASSEGASPPASGSIFVASALVGARPERTFLPLVIYYVVPITAIAVLIGLGVLPILT
ncbi:TRAP transporter large permease subunit [Microbacterium sp. G2-8]|uniref:TRAP transporter large permease subunit n=1 Tax=Microbacterium sp. G2-8 TaxID=2842454 RepID=UPI001C89C7BA|nr:TRAP transporter large permease subunit [Microbacterium sp. G2-8]